jgi:adenine-specific DNA methylase
MIPATCKRLIEVEFPIAKVSEHAAKEKSIRHGHPSTLHLWWARRPLAACRAVLLGLLLPDPCEPECPEDFKTAARTLLAKIYRTAAKTDHELRDLLLRFIGDFANWNNAGQELYLEAGRGLVKAAHPEETPVVADPFSGGGSIPLEALRLGCEAFASDLNPVACLILKTLLEDIPKYGNADFKLKDDHGKEIVVHGLADALRHVGKQIKAAAEKELGKFYPPDPDGSRPIAYIWARTVRCEAVGCGAEIPLVRSFWLSKKTGGKRALRISKGWKKGPANSPIIGNLEIFTPKTDDEVPAGTVARANATCLHCGSVLPAPRVRAQLAAQRGGADVIFDKHGHRTGGALLLAVAIMHDEMTGRNYRTSQDRDYAAVYAAQKACSNLPPNAVPDEPTPKGGGKGASRAFSVQNYGMMLWGDLFSARQKQNLTFLVSKIHSCGFPDELVDFLTLAVSRFSDINNALCRWESSKTQVRNLFTRQVLPMMWDYAEPSFIGNQAGDFSTTLGSMIRVVDVLNGKLKAGQTLSSDACSSPLATSSVAAWFTDPPYYDAVPYADLSDFFFVWLKRCLPNHPLLHDSFDKSNPLTPKTAECVQDETKSNDSKPKDRAFFERTMGKAFSEGRRVLRDDGIACVVFAHKTTEGWEALLTGMLRARWVITASWPLATELSNRLRAKDSAALATSVHLVCRPRPPGAGAGDWGDVKAAMEKRIHEWLPTLAKHGVRGADAIFSCLGPALESYSKYEKVLTAADREVPLGGNPDATEPHERGFLAYVFETLAREALRQVLGDAETEGLEEDARLAALFLWTLQTTKIHDGDGENEDEDETDDEDKPKKSKAGLIMPFDTFIRMTRPMGIHYPDLEGRIIEIEKGVVRMLPVYERTEALLGEVAKRPEVTLSLKDVQQMELGFTMPKSAASVAPLPTGRKKGGKQMLDATARAAFTTLDRLHRAMLLFGLGRSALLRQVLEEEQKQGKRLERLALALNALYPEGSDERRLLEGVQAAMRGVR